MKKFHRHRPVARPSDKRTDTQINSMQQEIERVETPEGAQAKVNMHASDKNNPHGVTAPQTGAYTQEQVDAILAAELEDYYSQAEVDSILAGYYTEAEVDSILAGYYTEEEVDSILGGYYTEVEVDSILEGYYTEAEVDSILEGYYTEAEVDQAIADATRQGGTTGDRPSEPEDYEMYFDTDLGHPIWYNGTEWVDAEGVIA